MVDEVLYLAADGLPGHLQIEKGQKVSDFGDEARAELAADALLRSADQVPGVHIAAQAEQLSTAIQAFIQSREQLRVAMNPELDPEGPGGRDAEWLAARQRDYVEARTWLREAAANLVQQIDYENPTEETQ